MRSISKVRCGALLAAALSVAALSIAALCVPAAAHAARPLASSGTGPVLGFGASYSDGGGTTSVHRGVDIAAEAGERVLAPVAGTVTFVGRVPGAGGSTVLAITLQTAAGSVTLLPLERASVSRGDSVSEGATLATLAENGDASFSATHLHVGLRAGSLYLDPARVLTIPLAVTSPEVPTGAEAGAAAVEVPSAAGASGGVQVGAGATVGGATASGASAGVGQGAAGTAVEVAAVSDVAALGAGAAAGEIAPGVSLSAAAGAPAQGFEPTGVLAETGQTLATGGRLAKAASSAVGEGRLGEMLSRGIQLAGRGARGAALLAVGLLGALGALWPLWRAGGLEGPSKVSVSAVREDVAAVASR